MPATHGREGSSGDPDSFGGDNEKDRVFQKEEVRGEGSLAPVPLFWSRILSNVCPLTLTLIHYYPNPDVLNTAVYQTLILTPNPYQQYKRKGIGYPNPNFDTHACVLDQFEGLQKASWFVFQHAGRARRLESGFLWWLEEEVDDGLCCHMLCCGAAHGSICGNWVTNSVMQTPCFGVKGAPALWIIKQIMQSGLLQIFVCVLFMLLHPMTGLGPAT